MRVLRMAWRNVWRNSRRSMMTMAAMTFSLVALVVGSGLLRGMMTGLEKNAVALETADLQVFAPGYQNRPSMHLRIDDPAALLSELDGLGYPASARLRGTGLVAAGNNSSSALLIGLDPSRDLGVSRVGAEVAEGTWIDPADENGVVVGRRLARTLGLVPGAEIVLLATAADGSMANDIYIVKGVLKSINDAVDRAGVYMNTDTFRTLLEVPDGAHQILVRRPETMTLAEAKAQVASLAPALDVKSWEDLLPLIAGALQTQAGSMVVLYLIIYLAVGILVLNAMLMAVFERIRELGVLKAVGMAPGEVFALIISEGAIQTVISIILGLFIAMPALSYLSTTGLDLESIAGIHIQGVAFDVVMRAEVDAATFKGPLMALVSVVFISMLFPALRAARLNPVEAIQHQ